HEQTNLVGRKPIEVRRAKQPESSLASCSGHSRRLAHGKARSSGRYVVCVLFLLFGSSAAGKTSALNELRDRMPGLAVHDHDEIGVPPAADTAWRQQANGELLATPSAMRLDAISAPCSTATTRSASPVYANDLHRDQRAIQPAGRDLPGSTRRSRRSGRQLRATQTQQRAHLAA